MIHHFFRTWLLLLFFFKALIIPSRQYKYSPNSLVLHENKWQLNNLMQRYSRQILPYENIAIYSVNSTVSMNNDGHVVVESIESQTNFNLADVDICVISNMSQFMIDSEETKDASKNFIFVSLNGTNFDLKLQDILQWKSVSTSLQLNSTTDYSSDPLPELIPPNVTEQHLKMRLSGILSENVSSNLHLHPNRTNSIKIEVGNGEAVGFLVESSQMRSGGQLQTRIVSALTSYNESVEINQRKRALYVTASVGNEFQLRIRFLISEIGLLFGTETRLDVSSSYRTIVIRQKNGFRIDLYSPATPFEILIDENGDLKISCFGGNTTIIMPSSQNTENPQMTIDVQQFLKMEANRTVNAKNSVQSDSKLNENGIFEQLIIAARTAQIKLSTKNEDGKLISDSIEINAKNSQMRIKMNNTLANMAAKNHQIDLIGERSKLLLETRSITIAISLKNSYRDDLFNSLQLATIEEHSSATKKMFDTMELQDIGLYGYAVNISDDYDHTINQTLSDVENVFETSIATIPLSELPKAVFKESNNLNNERDTSNSQSQSNNVQRVQIDNNNSNSVNNVEINSEVPNFIRFNKTKSNARGKSNASTIARNNETIIQTQNQTESFETTMVNNTQPINNSSEDKFWNQLFPTTVMNDEFNENEPDVVRNLRLTTPKQNKLMPIIPISTEYNTTNTIWLVETTTILPITTIKTIIKANENEINENEDDTFVIGQFDDSNSNINQNFSHINKNEDSIATTQYFPIAATISSIRTPSTSIMSLKNTNSPIVHKKSLRMKDDANFSNLQLKKKKSLTVLTQITDRQENLIKKNGSNVSNLKRSSKNLAVPPPPPPTTTTGVYQRNKMHRNITRRDLSKNIALNYSTIEENNVFEIYLKDGSNNRSNIADLRTKLKTALEQLITEQFVDYLKKHENGSQIEKKVRNNSWEKESRNSTRKQNFKGSFATINHGELSRYKDDVYLENSTDTEMKEDALSAEEVHLLNSQIIEFNITDLENNEKNYFTDSFLSQLIAGLLPNLSVELYEFKRIYNANKSENFTDKNIYRLRFGLLNKTQDNLLSAQEQNLLMQKIAQMLNDIGRDKLSETINFEVISNIRVKSVPSTLSSLLNSLIVIPAGILIIAFSTALMIWHISLAKTQSCYRRSSKKIGGISFDESQTF